MKGMKEKMIENSLSVCVSHITLSLLEDRCGGEGSGPTLYVQYVYGCV